MVFFLRLILSVLIAVLISRMYFKEITLFKVMGLTAVLFGFAYLFQYTKKQHKKE